VNSTGESGKSGCLPEQVGEMVDHARQAGLLVAGLMTVGPTSGDPTETAGAFTLTRSLVDELGLAECSMGMSGDLELAVALGSTQVRIGTALFGARPT
jgi:PLP dependent protein